MATKKNYFKVSDLNEIQEYSIDNADSFLITDYLDENGKKCVTKRISIGRLMNVIAKDENVLSTVLSCVSTDPAVISAILADEQLEQQISSKVDEAVKEEMNILSIYGGSADLSSTF